MANSTIITSLKQWAIRKIITNNEIVNAIDNPSMHEKGWKPIFLVNNNITNERGYTPSIYNFYKFPTSIDKTITFVCIMANTYQMKNENYVNAELHVIIFSHKDHMIVDNPSISDNRNDYIAKLVDRELNGNFAKYMKTDASLGKLVLVSSVEDTYDNNFSTRHMKFVCNDINYSLCETD